MATTDKQLQTDRLALRLLVHPGTTQQRCAGRAPSNRRDLRANLVSQARAKHGAGVSLVWANAENNLVEVTE